MLNVCKTNGTRHHSDSRNVSYQTSNPNNKRKAREIKVRRSVQCEVLTRPPQLSAILPLLCNSQSICLDGRSATLTAVSMKVQLATVSCSIISTSHSGKSNESETGAEGRQSREEWIQRSCDIVADMRERGTVKENIYREWKCTSSHKKKPREHRLFHSAAILSCHSFTVSGLFIYSSAIKVKTHLCVCVCVCFERKRLKNKIMKRIIRNVLLLVCRMSFELLPRNNYTLKKKKKLFVGPSINIYVHARDDRRRMMLKLSSILWTGFMHFTNI